MCATRRKGMKSIPNALSQAKNVFPITSFRARLANQVVAAANNEREIIATDLQFEDNEVLDIWGVEYNTYCDLTQLAAFNDQLLTIAVYEDPDKPATTDLSLEATF